MEVRHRLFNKHGQNGTSAVVADFERSVVSLATIANVLKYRLSGSHCIRAGVISDDHCMI